MSSSPATQPVGISQQEWRVRCDLAACYRAFVRFGWTDLIYTHISARHPTEEGLYLINPYGLLFEEISASNLIVVDFDGNVVRGDYPCNNAGHAIHSAVLAGRHEVNWVLHTHTRAGMAVSCMQCGLLPITQQAMFLHGHVAYHPWDLQTEAGECARMVENLGPSRHALVLQNHGLLTCAPAIGEAFTTMYLLESACKVQVDAMTAGTELVIPGDDVVRRTAEIGRPGALDGEREWRAMLRWLDCADPSYKR